MGIGQLPKIIKESNYAADIQARDMSIDKLNRKIWDFIANLIWGLK